MKRSIAQGIADRVACQHMCQQGFPCQCGGKCKGEDSEIEQEMEVHVHLAARSGRGISDILSTANHVRTNLELLATDCDKLAKLLRQAKDIKNLAEHQDFAQMGPPLKNMVRLLLPLAQDILTSAKELETVAPFFDTLR